MKHSSRVSNETNKIRKQEEQKKNNTIVLSENGWVQRVEIKLKLHIAHYGFISQCSTFSTGIYYFLFIDIIRIQF